MKTIVVLTGAGVSAESGVSTFRDSDGLWENHRVEDVASIEGWYRNPSVVLDFYNERRAQLATVKPNAAHLAIAALEDEYKVTVVTQNVDNLHERAGSTKIIHLHGELTKVRPENCCNDSDGYSEETVLQHCSKVLSNILGCHTSWGYGAERSPAEAAYRVVRRGRA